MKLKTDILKDLCQKIGLGIDNNDMSIITSSLSIKLDKGILYMGITNREYYLTTFLCVQASDEFDATVNASLFTKLISQITTEFVELYIDSATLIVCGNGNYKIPVIYENNCMLKLPEITISNITNDFSIDGNILYSINTINGKEMSKGVITKQVQKYYYLDSDGAITFNTGACVNNFTIPYQVKMLFTPRIVKLFKLFKDKQIRFVTGEDSISNGIIQYKVKFETDDIILTAVLFCDDTLLHGVPAVKIREIANSNYPSTISISKSELSNTINRIMLFSTSKDSLTKCYGTVEFDTDGVTVYDYKHENKECVKYVGSPSLSDKYSMRINLTDFKSTVENCVTDTIEIAFGNKKCIVVTHGNIKNVVPEVNTTA